MKTTICAVLVLMSLSGCHKATPVGSVADASVIESAILWKATLDSVTWAPIELKKLLGNSSRFTPDGNFYKVNDKTMAFGHEALYIGTIGIDMVSGPNVMLKGQPDEIAEQIAKQYGVKFEKQADEFHAKLTKDVTLIVAPHPSKKGTTLVIGAYFGK